MSWILAAETSSSLGSLALFKNQTLYDFVDWPSDKSHSEIIADQTVELLKKNNLRIEDLDKLATSIGPGSFTGIRVALNFIKSLAYTLDKPVITTNSLLLLAAPALVTEKKVFCFQTAFRNLIYCSGFEAENEKLDSTLVEIFSPIAQTPEQLGLLLPQHLSASALAIGRGADLLFQDLRPELSSVLKRNTTFLNDPHAKNFEFLFKSRSPLVATTAWPQVNPLYVRASEAEEKLRNN